VEIEIDTKINADTNTNIANSTDADTETDTDTDTDTETQRHSRRCTHKKSLDIYAIDDYLEWASAADDWFRLVVLSL